MNYARLKIEGADLTSLLIKAPSLRQKNNLCYGTVAPLVLADVVQLQFIVHWTVGVTCMGVCYNNDPLTTENMLTLLSEMMVVKPESVPAATSKV